MPLQYIACTSCDKVPLVCYVALFYDGMKCPTRPGLRRSKLPADIVCLVLDAKYRQQQRFIETLMHRPSKEQYRLSRVTTPSIVQIGVDVQYDE